MKSDNMTRIAGAIGAIRMACQQRKSPKLINAIASNYATVLKDVAKDEDMAIASVVLFVDRPEIASIINELIDENE
jgi:hypothetical protein